MISNVMKKRIQATWLLRRMLRKPLIDKLANEKVAENARTQKGVIKKLCQWQTTFFGLVIRKKELDNLHGINWKV